MNHKEQMVVALQKKFEAEMAEAVLVFNNYLNNPCAIGEHPQLLEEAAKSIAQWEHNHSNLEALKHMNELLGQ